LGKGTSGARLDALADKLVAFDIIALQEIQTDSGLDALIQVLNAHTRTGTDVAWSYVSSSGCVANGGELYAFVYRSDLMERLPGPEGVYPESSPEDFSRPPFFATFRAGAFDFTLITVHIKWGQSASQRIAECHRLASVWDYVQGLPPSEKDVILLGDFNCSAPTHEAFEPLLFTGIVPILTDPGTLTALDGWYDNIWIDGQSSRARPTGVLGVGTGDINCSVGTCISSSMAPSNHCPVFAEFLAFDRSDADSADSYGSVIEFESIDFDTGVIRLRNLTDETVPLFGWRLYDEEGWYIFPVGSAILPFGRLILTREQQCTDSGRQGFYLRASGESVYLYPPGPPESVIEWIPD